MTEEVDLSARASDRIQAPQNPPLSSIVARTSKSIPTFRSVRSLVQPVSRVWFELSDTAAFSRSIELAVEWMSAVPKGSDHPRSGVQLPPSAMQGLPFDITDELGANPTKAVRLEAQDGLLWAARLDWPDRQAPRTWVSEFFVEKRSGQMARFGAQLTCVRRGECPPTLPTRPTVVRSVLEALSAEADGRQLSDIVEMTQAAEIDEIIDLLYAEGRRLPVIIVSEPDPGHAGFPVKEIARHVAGSAHIVNLSREASWELSRKIGRRMSAFRGAARLYQPGLSENAEDPFAHPLWRPQQHLDGSVVRQIASRVLPAAFLDRSQNAFPRYAEIRDAAAAFALQNDRTSNDVRDEFDLAGRKAAELTEERDLWMSLAEEQEHARLAAENEVERLKAEIARLESKSKALEFGLGNRTEIPDTLPTRRQLESYDDLEEWAEETLEGSVYIHSSALKDCRKNGHPAMLPRIEATLLIMCDHMTPARRNGDAAQRETARQKLGEWGFEDSACFVDREEAYRRAQYSVQYDGITRVLYDHIKYGNGYNNANQVRIYYFWDEEKEVHVVGKMPPHLPNNLTN